MMKGTGAGTREDPWVARIVAAAIGALVVAVLYETAPRIGYARDEGFYFDAATSYGRWLELLWDQPEYALTRQAVDAHFRINAEHPSLMKLLFALSHRLLHVKLGLIPTPGLAFRFPGMLMAGLATGLVVLWGSRSLSLWAGVMGGMLFIAMPRVFHHAHLACFDVPVVAVILLTVYAYHRATTSHSLGWALLSGLFYGLALDTKHNAWSLPAVLALHWIVSNWSQFPRMNWRERGRSILPLLSMSILGPVVLWLLWPWLWFDTAERLRFWIEFHLHHDYYNMEFLGQTYHRPPMPRAYAWVMTLATVPLTTLGLAIAGVTVSIRKTLAGSSHWRTHGDLLWLLCLLSAYAPWWSSSTPIFGGTKHWLPAYPFLCLFAARGFELFAARWRTACVEWRLERRTTVAAACLVSLGCLSAPLAITWHSLPFGLSAYTPLVGGAPGAASLGLNRTFWGYTSIEFADTMSALLPRGGRVFVHDTAISSWRMHQRDGRIANHLSPTLEPTQSSLALYHYEPHMSRVEYQIWEAYGTTSPEAVATFDGVPVVWLYARPELESASRHEVGPLERHQ